MKQIIQHFMYNITTSILRTIFISLLVQQAEQYNDIHHNACPTFVEGLLRHSEQPKSKLSKLNWKKETQKIMTYQ